MVQTFDVIFVADPRFPGGTSTALASEIAAAGRSKIRTALFAVKGPLLERTYPFHSDIRSHLENGNFVTVDPSANLACRFAIIHHPTLFEKLPTKPIKIAADKVVLMAHHPVTNGARQLQYDLPAVMRNIREIFGKNPVLAPVGPAVRDSLFASQVHPDALTMGNWHNLINADDWPYHVPVPGNRRIVVGRHSRPSLLKWPDTREQAVQCYPDDARYRIRILGGDAGLVQRYGDLPPTWELIPFGGADVLKFLGSLDFYVYFHSSEWVEAFGRSILEAMVSGPVVILPPQFRTLFGDAAHYCEPEAVRDAIEHFWSRPDALAAQSEKARHLASCRFSLDGFADRLETLYPGWREVPAGFPPCVSRPSASEPKPTVMFFTSNGIGLGHVTRSLAVAKRLPQRFESVFFSLSYATKIISDAGYLAEYHPFHRAIGADVERWNSALAEELHMALSFYRPSVFVFDGNYPYSGMIGALAEFPDLITVWMRRAFWPERTSSTAKRPSAIDFVVEPGELADRFDRGATVEQRHEVYRVAPILYVDPSERMNRDEARRFLGCAPQDMVVAISLGSGNNFDLATIRASLLKKLCKMENTYIVEFASPLREAVPPDASLPRHRSLNYYPMFELSAAFDFAVAGAGYNSFHEMIMGGIPTIFVPNEAEEMDMQIIRARYAESVGIARMLRAWDVHGVSDLVREFASPDYRDRLAQRCRALRPSNGAPDAARFVAEMAIMARTDRDPFFACYADDPTRDVSARASSSA